MSAAERNSVAIVTGAASGMGRASAERFLAEGWTVAAFDRDGTRLADLATQLGPTLHPVEVDITERSSVEAALATTESALGPVDVLVNNAGIAEAAPLVRTEPEVWERHFRINVTGPYLATRAVLPAMLDRGWGRVINVASLAGLHGAPYVTAYTASKHALVGFTRALAAEVAGRGVTVNALCPGYVATDMVWSGARNVAARTGRSFEDAVQAMAHMNPGSRLIAPEEVAAAAVQLYHDHARNGEAVVLDGTDPVPASAGARSEEKR